MKKVIAVVAVMITSMFFVMSASAATTYSAILNDSYTVMAFANATEATIAMIDSGSTYATWRGTSQYGSALDWLFEFFMEPNDLLANLNYSNRNHVTWRFSLWASSGGKYDKNGIFININSQYSVADAIYPAQIVGDGTGYTSFYFDFDLPGHVTDLNYISLYIPFTSAQTSVGIETYEFKVVSYGEADEILEEDFGYSKPSTPEQDAGLQAGNDLLDEMTDAVDEFNATVTDNTQVLIDNISRIKDWIDGAFNAIPLPITLTVSGVVVFLVIRKVVGR